MHHNGLWREICPCIRTCGDRPEAQRQPQATCRTPGNEDSSSYSWGDTSGLENGVARRASQQGGPGLSDADASDTSSEGHLLPGEDSEDSDSDSDTDLSGEPGDSSASQDPGGDQELTDSSSQDEDDSAAERSNGDEEMADRPCSDGVLQGETLQEHKL